MNGIFGVDSIRPSQLVSTFGSGSIYDNLTDSFLIMGTDRWNEQNCKPLKDTTLLSYLQRGEPRKYSRLDRFLVPISSNEDDTPVAIRTFPKWGICPECNMLQQRNIKTGLRNCRSTSCNGRGKNSQAKTIPVKFIAACINGHLEDFPWYRWAHRGKVDNCSENDARLYLYDENTSSSLEDKIIKCTNCGRKERMIAALSKRGLRYVLPEGCKGRRPWLTTDDSAPCVDRRTGEMAFLQGIYKGATNVYFPKTVRSITIPSFADPLTDRIADKIEGTTLLTASREMLDLMIPELFPNVDRQEILQRIDILKDRETRPRAPDLYTEEFHALNSRKFPHVGTEKKDFKTEPIELPETFSEYLDNLVLVRRLREVVILTGFYRLEPFGYSSDDHRKASPITNYPEEQPRWLPAVENRGEGIFFSFSNEILYEWIEKPEVKQRFREIMSHTQNVPTSSDIAISQKYVFLHTLSHLAIREIANYAGYSVSSMRERIYSDTNMAGILIYTSSPSSDGSLGGLVEQGKKPKFNLMLQKALKKSRLCSMDPLCSSASPGTGNRPNGSACHACLYLPETSCESMNSFLDRSFIHSTLYGNETGLFA